ncbi:Uncharacterized protein family UPF0646 [Penicillium expansum]|uniref:Uncharacterized protein family UPF0646 n=1 Tax=Penicillium expansum TaxID=27334 RepID=A0A0A2KHT3_PENEN|nr:Uncharacterized protein family UPF0646 [Penicillium expansum]KGO38751.1 Uncharacterized protein family UPF0646 [Penicillium expansum]KGO54278.1 Uncharacterized protein family UPF0646 [Penicillium expansum]KGO66466.1 Uncharacterized protein family UPF0646 [Penicillium expansum]
MEVPATGDSMEMASPYQGPADDFDIDIDLMEDHVSNMDSDMMGADEFTSTSQPNELNNDAIYDADMADEPSEGSMIDADNYADEDNDIDVQFEEEPYEEEMIETDEAEAVNIPAPVIHLEPAGSNGDATSTIKEDATVTTAEPLEAATQGPSGSVEFAPVQDEAQASGVEGLDMQAQLNTVGDDGLAEEPSETVISPETGGHTENSELSEEANKISQSAVSETEVTQVPNEDPETSQIKHSAEDSHDDDDAHLEAQPVSEGNHSVVGEDASLQQVTYIDEPLHPVKILYQDCEIALFPPLEGDLADTFFIEDEALAYENIGQIFKALREVLQKTMAGNEVLVIDIDTLGIQMTEDSFHTSQVTLHQILDLYVRLCRNDGTADPDALYLTLSTKRAFPAEIADLNDAAIEGKKLSELHSELHAWDEYDEAEPGSDEDLGAHGAEEHEDEVYYTNEAQKELSITEVQTAPGPEEEQALDDEQSQVQPEDVPSAQPEFVHAQDANRSTSSERSPEAAPVSEPHLAQPENEEADHSDVSHHIERDQEHDHDRGDINEEHYDSEGRQSDSTATVAALPSASEIKEHVQHVPLDVTADAGTDQNDDENFYGEELENDDLGAEEYYEHEDIGSVDDSEAFQKDITGSENIDFDAQEPADQTSVLDEEDADELDAPPTDEVVSEIILQDENNHPSHDQPAPPLGSGLNDASDKKEQTPEPADDLLGIAVDLMQTPPKDIEDDALDHFEGIDYNEPEDELDAPVAADDESADDHEFDENHFGDYDTHFEESEAVELVGTDPSLTDPQTNQSSSAKRSREDEDDWDLVETTVDTKRRRSS